MSWVKTVSQSSDDVFDEEADELRLQSKEWNSTMKKRIKGGYVDGADAGEEAALQLGFNQGFREGAARTVAVGRLRGIVSAISCWCQIENPGNPVPVRVTELLQWVSKHEERVLEGIRRSMEDPPPTVSDVSESMEDLDVEQAPAWSGQSCHGEGCEKTDCCKTGQIMDLEPSQQPQRLCSEPATSSPLTDEDLNFLLQRCTDVVAELGLPQELLGHVEELRSV